MNITVEAFHTTAETDIQQAFALSYQRWQVRGGVEQRSDERKGFVEFVELMTVLLER